MRHSYEGLVWVTGLMLAVLLGGCQAAQGPPAPQAVAPTTLPATQAAPPTKAIHTTPPATAAPAATAEPTRTPTSYETFEIPAPSLKDNQLGESDRREIRVYLPPSYFSSNARYPVVYYLPGYTDSSMLGFSLPGDADKLMRGGGVRQMIIVVASGDNQLGGSFYVNSSATGRWEDFIVNDVVGYVDTHYRTVAQAGARAITGHSMGGFGALNIGMRHPEVFSVVYSLSPGLFDANGLAESQMFDSEGFINRFIDYNQRVEALAVEQARKEMLRSPDDFTLGYGLAFAPNVEKHPPFMDYPFTLADGKLVRNDAIWKKWDAGFGGIPDKIKRYKANMMRLNGLVVDYGRFDEYAWIPKGCEYFGAQLTAAGIPHELRSYDGGHETQLSVRIRDYMLPFVSERLDVE